MFFLDEQKLKETKEEKITHTTDLVESVNEECEILVVQGQIGSHKIRIINWYGPQEDQPVNKRLLFWQAMGQEIIA